MKIGIVGPAERAHAWENHLRSHQSVSEVVITASLGKIDSVDACFLLDESSQRINTLLQAVKAGYHTFFISKLPTDKTAARKIYHTAQEANVIVQFSHWPTLAPASRWMHHQIKHPAFIRVNREIQHPHFTGNNLKFSDLWVDELAYCLKYIDSPAHQFDVHPTALASGKKYALHLLIHFENGAAAAVNLCTCARGNRHSRLVSNHALILNCDVDAQTVLATRENNGRLAQKEETFDASLAADQAVSRFLKSVQLGIPALFNSYDLLQTARLVHQVRSRL